MAGHTLRFNAVVDRLRGLVSELGRLDSLTMSQRFPPQLQIEWLDDPRQSGGGSILHTGVHCFDLVHHLSDLEPESVSCTVRSIYTRRTEDNFASEIALSGGCAVALVGCSRSTSGRNGLIEITGEHGQLIGDHVHNLLYRMDGAGRTELDPGPAKQTVRLALESFAADIAADRQPTIPYRDGLRAVAVADACYRSASSGRREHVVMPDRGP
jgi:predicted dehydrogenase